ncbi:MAG: TonB-dependent receptor plug domain-containing protein [Bacteroidetes bacterium]|nr:TonB-dependent receptor plug domain-containing protein [Bacteroidota bacterium]
MTGTVTDVTTGEPVIGANVIIEGTTIGVITDVDGKFGLDLPKPDAIIVISYLGYNSERITFNGQSVLDIKLVPDITKLDEVVVIGYGKQSRREITSAISSVKSQDLENIPVASLDNLLQGKASGMQVSQNSGQPGGAISVRIRGNSSVQGGNDPLYVVDGMLIQSNSIDRLADGGGGSNPLTDINPSDIESVQILKDAAATSIYGARASNGVVLITTKRGKTGAPTIKASYYYGMQEITKTIPQINAPQFREYVREAWKNSGR